MKKNGDIVGLKRCQSRRERSGAVGIAMSDGQVCQPIDKQDFLAVVKEEG